MTKIEKEWKRFGIVLKKYKITEDIVKKIEDAIKKKEYRFYYDDILCFWNGFKWIPRRTIRYKITFDYYLEMIASIPVFKGKSGKVKYEDTPFGKLPMGIVCDSHGAKSLRIEYRFLLEEKERWNQS